MITKWAKDLNIHFYEEDIQMANRYMLRDSMHLILKSSRKHESKLQWDIISLLLELSWKQQKIKWCWQECREKEPSYTIGGTVKWYRNYTKHHWFLQKLKTELL